MRWLTKPPHALLFFAAASLWVAVLWTAFHPGLMSSDTLDQYQQGISGHEFNNHHPPLMSWVLGLAARLVGSPWPALLLALMAISGAAAVLAAGAATSRLVSSFLLFATFLVLPPTWAVGVVIWKDVWVAATLLWAVVALRAGRRATALALLMTAACWRHNAIAAAVPLAVVAVWDRARPKRSALIGTAAIFLISLAPLGVERALHARDTWPLGFVLVYDLAGIYVRHPEDFSASTFSGEVEVSDLARDYSRVEVGPLLLNDFPPGRRIAWSSVAPRRGEVMREWLREVAARPGAYLAHRTEHFGFLLGIGTETACYPFHWQIDPNPWGLALSDSKLHRLLRRLADRTGPTTLFRGWPWLAIASTLAVLAARRAIERPLVFATALSALLYTGAYLFVGISCGFRFLYWTQIATFAVGFLLLAPDGRANARRALRGEPTLTTG